MIGSETEGNHGQSPRRDYYQAGIYEEIPFGVWMADSDGGLRYASDSFLELLGMSMAEASRFGWTIRIAPESTAAVEQWRQCVESGQDWDGEYRIRDRGGELKTVLARGRTVRDASGNIDHWIGIHLDVDEAAHAIRDLAVELTPPVLVESGLMAALEWLADWVKKKHRLGIDLDIEPDVRLDDRDICLLLFDVVQELLLNVAKYAKVDSARVHAKRKGEDVLQITVADNGAGCDPERITSNDDPASGFGLSTVRQRIESVGGTFQFDSAIGQGTTATIVVPMRQE